MLVFPKLTASLWDGPRNAAFVDALRTIARLPETTGGTAARLAGGPPLTADIIASMRHDGPLASLLAFFGVVLTVLLLFRARLATPYVLSALLVGVLWMLALRMAHLSPMVVATTQRRQQTLTATVDRRLSPAHSPSTAPEP